MRALPVSLLLLVAAAACGGTQYTYAPATTSGAEIHGTRAAEYPAPANGASARVRVAALGVGEVEPPPEAIAPAFRAVYVRMQVDNPSSVDVVVDEAEQRIETKVGASLVASHATTPTAARPPVVTVAAGKSATLDLLFPLPPGLEDAGELPAFDVVWTVRAGSRTTTARTPFARAALPAPPRAPTFYEPLPPPRRGPGPLEP